MPAHRFGASQPFSVGIEEELFVLDAETLEPASVPDGVLDGVRLKAELFTTMLELTTGVCADVAEAVEELAALRVEARRRLHPHGLELAAVGTWPTAVLGEQPVTPLEPLRRFAEYAGPSALRQHCSGLHVHVGVSSPEECMGRLEAVLPLLPAVLALSAEFLAFAQLLVKLDLADDFMRLWWDVRPHPRLGTLEIRAPDQPTRLADTAALAGLCHALVVAAEPAAACADRGLYAQNRWAAARFGAQAGLIHPETRELTTPQELLGGLDGLDQAGEQLAIGRSDGLRALRERLVALTYDQL